MGIKRLFFDIEVSPNIGFFWQPGHKISLGYENIIKERAIICICYKWAGSDKVYSLQWDKNQDDKEMLAKFVKVANLSDEMVGHNGDNFDLKWIRTRCLFHDIDMMPNYTTIDTLKEARKGFRFNSNRLDYISKFIGLEGKIKTEFNLWKLITLNNDKKSLKYMVEYCKNDVTELEKVYDRLHKYIKPKTSIAQYRCDCPNCGSEKTKIQKSRVSAAGVRLKQIQCQDCGKYFTTPEATYNREIALKKKKEDYMNMKKSLNLD